MAGGARWLPDRACNEAPNDGIKLLNQLHIIQVSLNELDIANTGLGCPLGGGRNGLG
jgi:hypothetical protein